MARHSSAPSTTNANAAVAVHPAASQPSRHPKLTSKSSLLPSRHISITQPLPPPPQQQPQHHQQKEQQPRRARRHHPIHRLPPEIFQSIARFGCDSLDELAQLSAVCMAARLCLFTPFMKAAVVGAALAGGAGELDSRCMSVGDVGGWKHVPSYTPIPTHLTFLRFPDALPVLTRLRDAAATPSVLAAQLRPLDPVRAALRAANDDAALWLLDLTLLSSTSTTTATTTTPPTDVDEELLRLAAAAACFARPRVLGHILATPRGAKAVPRVLAPTLIPAAAEGGDLDCLKLALHAAGAYARLPDWCFLLSAARRAVALGRWAALETLFDLVGTDGAAVLAEGIVDEVVVGCDDWEGVEIVVEAVGVEPLWSMVKGRAAMKLLAMAVKAEDAAVAQAGLRSLGVPRTDGDVYTYLDHAGAVQRVEIAGWRVLGDTYHAVVVLDVQDRDDGGAEQVLGLLRQQIPAYGFRPNLLVLRAPAAASTSHSPESYTTLVRERVYHGASTLLPCQFYVIDETAVHTTKVLHVSTIEGGQPTTRRVPAAFAKSFLLARHLAPAGSTPIYRLDGPPRNKDPLAKRLIRQLLLADSATEHADHHGDFNVVNTPAGVAAAATSGDSLAALAGTHALETLFELRAANPHPHQSSLAGPVMHRAGSPAAAPQLLPSSSTPPLPSQDWFAVVDAQTWRDGSVAVVVLEAAGGKVQARWRRCRAGRASGANGVHAVMRWLERTGAWGWKSDWTPLVV
ncbi:hypothetical protein DFJ73DRAFT_27238 [Zopfochytrium polystomum]|nr:hypothetical protein DFJ73DRAFT_27238 [Zopfochytrium polystomum]